MDQGSTLNQTARRGRGVGPLARHEADGLEVLGRIRGRQRGDLGTGLFPGQDPLGVDRHHPAEAPLAAGLAQGLGLEGRVPQHDHLGPGRHGQGAQQLGGQLDPRAVGEASALAAGPGVETAAAADAQAAGRPQQPADEAVATALGLLLLLAVALLGPGPDVGAAEGVLGVLARLAHVRLVQKEVPGAVTAGFDLQQQVGDGGQGRQSRDPC